MNPLKKLAGQTAIYGLSSVFGRLLNYFLVPLYTRVFLPAEYGVVTELYAYVSFLTIVFTYGMETAFFRFNETETDKKKVFSTALFSIVITTSVLTILCILFSPWIASELRYTGHENYIAWFALILAFDSITAIPFVKLRAGNQPAKFAALKLFNILVNVFLNVFFLIICPYVAKQPAHFLHGIVTMVYTPDMGVGYIFISNLIASALTLLMLIPEMIDLRAGFDRELWKRMLLYALPLLAAGLAGMVNETFDRILLKYLLPDKNMAMEQIGIYGACYKLSILMTLFIQMFKYAAEPFFFSHAAKNNARQIYADVMNYFVIVCSFIFLGIMMYIDVVKYFIGEKYYSGLSVVPVLLLANLCLGVFFNLSIWYKLTGQTRFGAYLAIFGAVVTLVLNVWWIPLFGYAGSAWATLACYAAMMVLSYMLGQKYYPVPYESFKYLAYIAGAVILYLFSTWIRFSFHPGNMVMLILNTLLLFMYAGLVFVTLRRKKTVLSQP